MPPIIEVRDLSKEFRTFRRREGLLGALQNLFGRDYTTIRAVDRVSFAIAPGEAVASLFFLLAVIVWNKGVENYSSTGS